MSETPQVVNAILTFILSVEVPTSLKDQSMSDAKKYFHCAQCRKHEDGLSLSVLGTESQLLRVFRSEGTKRQKGCRHSTDSVLIMRWCHVKLAPSAHRGVLFRRRMIGPLSFSVLLFLYLTFLIMPFITLQDFIWNKDKSAVIFCIALCVSKYINMRFHI